MLLTPFWWLCELCYTLCFGFLCHKVGVLEEGTTQFFFKNTVVWRLIFLLQCFRTNLSVFLLKGQMTCLQNYGMWAQGSAFMASRRILVQQWSLTSRSLWQAPLTTLWPAGNGVPEPGPSTFEGTQGRVGCPFPRLSVVTWTSFLKARSQECDLIFYLFFNLTCLSPLSFSVIPVNPFIQVVLIWHLFPNSAFFLPHLELFCLYPYVGREQFSFSPSSFIACWTISPLCFDQISYLQIE